jgi:hypothetical protein
VQSIASFRPVGFSPPRKAKKIYLNNSERAPYSASRPKEKNAELLKKSESRVKSRTGSTA